MLFPTLREHTVTLVSCRVKETVPEWARERLGESAPATTTRGAVYDPRAGSLVLSSLYVDGSCVAFVSFMLVIQFSVMSFWYMSINLRTQNLIRNHRCLVVFHVDL